MKTSLAEQQRYFDFVEAVEVNITEIIRFFERSSNVSTVRPIFLFPEPSILS